MRRYVLGVKAEQAYALLASVALPDQEISGRLRDGGGEGGTGPGVLH